MDIRRVAETVSYNLISSLILGGLLFIPLLLLYMELSDWTWDLAAIVLAVGSATIAGAILKARVEEKLPDKQRAREVSLTVVIAASLILAGTGVGLWHSPEAPELTTSTHEEGDELYTVTVTVIDSGDYSYGDELYITPRPTDTPRHEAFFGMTPVGSYQESVQLHEDTESFVYLENSDGVSELVYILTIEDGEAVLHEVDR